MTKFSDLAVGTMFANIAGGFAYLRCKVGEDISETMIITPGGLILDGMPEKTQDCDVQPMGDLNDLAGLWGAAALN